MPMSKTLDLLIILHLLSVSYPRQSGYKTDSVRLSIKAQRQSSHMLPDKTNVHICAIML